ncbi:hypothetical protein BV22DRAFT_1128583 [Leucogyrophana mollusca]|uniref:Uncharacterized protein n=1 Tax=Leucogyrophana mollusca TaxID=85980 RepID=A0ACB8BN62_9AGAM|nr:hypothetical protein BV22DRAFT_1128583 [Leucogyrophana mollusca]
MFNNSTDIDASHSTFSEVHHDQHNTTGAVTVQGNHSTHTIVHGNQISNGRQSSISYNNVAGNQCNCTTTIKTVGNITNSTGNSGASVGAGGAGGNNHGFSSGSITLSF